MNSGAVRGNANRTQPEILVTIVCAVSLCVLVAGPPVQAEVPGARPMPEICPDLTAVRKRSVAYQRSDNVIAAAASGAETAAARADLRASGKEVRDRAITSLALAGDVDAFKTLLASRDATALGVYAQHYFNADGTSCIADELEDAVQEFLHDASLGRPLVGLLANNTYRRKPLFHALVATPFELTHADAYLPLGRALTATFQPGVEADVLQHARTLLPFSAPVEKRALPSLHQHYVKFFVERQHMPAVAYFGELLDAADRAEPVQSFQIQYGMLRTTAQTGLADLGGDEASALLLRELTRIADASLDPFAMSELQNLAKLIPRISKAARARSAAVDQFKRLLGAAQPARFDYPMRRTVYNALSELGGDDANGALIAELSRFLGDEPPPNRNAAVAQVFDALRRATRLDSVPLVALAGELNSPYERGMLLDLLGNHPSNEGVDYVLSELRARYVASGSGADTGSTAAWLNVLRSLPQATYQDRARDGIDAILDEGLMTTRDYLATAGALNQALGDESPRYVAFLEQQAEERAAAEHAALREGIATMRAEFDAELARQSTVAGVSQNVAALSSFGSGAKRAAQWLILAGEPILPELHTALGAPGTSDKQIVQLLGVLGEIGSVTSGDPIIEISRDRVDDGYHRPAFFALALIPPTPATIAFAEAQLADDAAPRRQAAALVYLARVRHPPAAVWVEPFTRTDRPPPVRSAGLYLGARLTLPGMTEQLTAILAESHERSVQEFLLQSLAAVAVDGSQFAALSSAAGVSTETDAYRESLNYSEFRTSASSTKAEFAYRLLDGGVTWFRREAIRYLIDTDPRGLTDRITGGLGKFMPLPVLLAQSPAAQLLFSESRRRGFRLAQSEFGYALSKDQRLDHQ